ncbi:MAG: hypothetical protein QOE50_362, partial [Sphingomonadales bacterium]|nr:hypothetical protein [Sphingomonadales bacterium]
MSALGGKRTLRLGNITVAICPPNERPNVEITFLPQSSFGASVPLFDPP